MDEQAIETQEEEQEEQEEQEVEVEQQSGNKPKRLRLDGLNDVNEAPEHPWERMPRESRQAFSAFAMYRDMGPDRRSLRKVAQEVGKNNQLISRWSSMWGWVLRAEAYDRELDRNKREERKKAIERMEEMHAATAVTILTKAVQRLQTVEALDELTANDAVRWIVEAVKVERLSRGVGTERTEVSGPDRGPLELEVNSGDGEFAGGARLGGILAVLEQAGVIARPGSNPEDAGASAANTVQSAQSDAAAGSVPDVRLPRGTLRRRGGGW